MTYQIYILRKINAFKFLYVLKVSVEFCYRFQTSEMRSSRTSRMIFQISPKPEMLTSLINAERKHFRLWWNYENHRAAEHKHFRSLEPIAKNTDYLI